MLKHFRAKASLLALACGSCFATHAIAEQAKQINVPAGDLIPALKILAGQSGAEFVYRSEDLEGLRTRGVSGNLTSQEAVRKLLEGTNLVLTEDASGAVLVAPRGANPPLASPDNEGSGARRTSDSFRLAQVAQGQIAVSAAETSTSSARESGQLEEIIVTAERRVEDMQKIAASVTVRGGDQLQVQGKYSLANILEDVPGISGGAAEAYGLGGAPMDTDNAASGLTIRGIGSNRGAGGGTVSVASTAAMYVDDVYGGVGGNYDIDRVEVLRGPQGTLYGRSATSGLVAVHTRNPDLEKFGGAASAEFGNYALQHYTFAVNAPIVSDQLAVRVSGNHYGRDGYYGHFDSGEAEGGKGGGVSTTEGRIKLLYKSNDAFSVLLGAALQNTDFYTGGALLAANATTDPGEAIWQSAPVRKMENISRQYWAEVNWNLGFATLTYLPAYRTYYQNGASISQSRGGSSLGYLNIYVYTPKDHFHTEEIRLTSNPDSKLSWQVGALYYDNDLTNHNTWVYENTGLLFHKATTEKSTQAAGIFAQATYPFADAWRFTAGVRYDYTKVATGEAYTSNPGAGQGLDLTLPTVYLDQRDGTRRFNNWTYKLRVEHDLTPGNLLYASISTGFSPGDLSLTNCGSGGSSICTIELDAETLTSYEVGSKNRFLDERLQVNGAVFYNDYGAFQDGAYNVSSDPNVLAFATLAVPVQVWGAELELQYQLTPADRLGLNTAYTNARYVDKPALFTTLANANDHLATSPLTSSLSYEHLFTLPGCSTLSLHGDVRYQSAHDGRSLTAGQKAGGGASVTRIEAQTVGNLSTTWTLANGAFSFTGWVRNVTDERYFNSISIGNSAPPFTLTLDEPTDPRTYGVVANVKF